MRNRRRLCVRARLSCRELSDRSSGTRCQRPGGPRSRSAPSRASRAASAGRPASPMACPAPRPVHSHGTGAWRTAPFVRPSGRDREADRSPCPPRADRRPRVELSDRAATHADDFTQSIVSVSAVLRLRPLGSVVTLGGRHALAAVVHRASVGRRGRCLRRPPRQCDRRLCSVPGGLATEGRSCPALLGRG